MSLNVDVQKHLAMQNVSIAVRLDSDGSILDAYRKYLECIEFMSHQLFLDASESEALPTSDATLKFIALCRQCIDRAEDLTKTLPIHSASMMENSFSTKDPNIDINFSSTSHNQPNFGYHIMNMPVNPPPRPPVLTSQSTRKEMSPVEVAHLQNNYLLAMHKVRIERMSAHNQAATNLSLSLQRRLMENMTIAQQKQSALERKKEDRLKELREEADRRFRCRDGMAPEELARRKLYTEILEFEQDVKWLMELRKKVPERCRDESFILASVHKILSTSDHPLTRLLQGYQFNTCQHVCDSVRQLSSSTFMEDKGATAVENQNNLSQNEIIPVSSELPIQQEMDLGQKNSVIRNGSSNSKALINQLLTGLVTEVQGFLEKLETMFVVVYENFNDDDVRCILREALEDIFFQPVWPHILSLFRQSTYQKEQTMWNVMKSCSAFLPTDIGVSEKFSLVQSPSDSAQSAPTSVPYEAAINSFRSILQITSISKKLDCIVRSFQIICQCIDECYEHSTSTPPLGADEMLPILSYILLKTELPLLVTECAALMEFIDDSSLMGERGYCLTSVLTATDFLLTLSPKSLSEAKP